MASMGVGMRLGVALRACVYAGLVALAGCNGAGSGTDALVSNEARSSTPAALSDSSQAEAARIASRYTDEATPGSVGYRVGPQDVLDITVFMVPDLTKSVQVSERGMINLPLVGDVKASGSTAADIERQLQSRLGARYLKNPQVTVFVKEYNSQRITLEGAIKKPGVYPLRGHDTLMRTLAMGEGIDRDTASSNVVVFRRVDGTRNAIRYDLDEIRGGRAEDPQVQAGDVIFVDDSAVKTAFSIFVKTLPIASSVALKAI